MPFRNFVEIGRVAYISYGRYAKKLCVIVDVIDQNRALVDGPRSDVPRCQVRFKQLHLTKFVIRIPHSTSSRVIRKAWDKANITKEWQKTGWYKRLQMRKVKSKLTDFDRFKLMVLKKKRNYIVKTALAKMKAKMAAHPEYKKTIIRPQRKRHAKITKTKKEALLKLKKAKLWWQSQKKHKERLKKEKEQKKYEAKKLARDPNKPVKPKRVVLVGKKRRTAEALKRKEEKLAKKVVYEARVAAGEKPKKRKGVGKKIKPKVMKEKAKDVRRRLRAKRRYAIQDKVAALKAGKKTKKGKATPKKLVQKKTPKKSSVTKKPSGDKVAKTKKPKKKTSKGGKPKAEAAAAPVAAAQ